MEITIGTEIITAFIGIFGSFIIQAIKKYSGVDGHKALLLTGIVSVLLGITISWVTDSITGTDLAKDIAIVFSFATLTYKLLLQSKPAELP